jgi:chromate transport protein ChrA
MNDQRKKRLYRSAKARWFHRGRWLILAAAPLLTVTIAARASADRLKQFGDLGLVQPSISALTALVVVLSMRLTWGRFATMGRKGRTSASSAVIAVQLWALCFALLFGSMLLSSAVSRWSGTFAAKNDPFPKSVETELQVTANQSAPAEVKTKVIR